MALNYKSIKKTGRKAIKELPALVSSIYAAPTVARIKKWNKWENDIEYGGVPIFTPFFGGCFYGSIVHGLGLAEICHLIDKPIDIVSLPFFIPIISNSLSALYETYRLMKGRYEENKERQIQQIQKSTNLEQSVQVQLDQ